MTSLDGIFNITSQEEFAEVALAVFEYQFTNSSVYRSFCDLLYVHPSSIKDIAQIPFLPVGFFKTHHVYCSTRKAEKTFASSGTTGKSVSKHHIADLALYKRSAKAGFEYFYGDLKDYVILALLPNYLERAGSSLVYMVADFIAQSENADSGFYLNNLDTLAQKLVQLDASGYKVLLIGVSFALLDLVEKYQFNLSNTMVMETGGMKGRRKELVREELHYILKAGFGIANIHSEYGMTELLSQAYSRGEGIFKTPPWMRVFIRETTDALSLEHSGKVGGVNVIDLANYNSCSFIATQDLGRTLTEDTFEILGRFDNAILRGCNLMVE